MMIWDRVRSAARSNVTLRLVDQGSWSAAFFLFTLSSSHVLPLREFASLTVVTSIGVIAAACARAFAMDGRIVAGTRLNLRVDEALSSSAVLLTSMAFALLATVASAVWLTLGQADASLLPTAVAGLIVLADGPHYLLTLRKRFAAAIVGALPYAVGAIVVALSAVFGLGADVLLVWMTSLAVSLGVSWCTIGTTPQTARAVPGVLGTSIRISAEALYSALGSQLGILIIYLVASPTATAGIRLAYSIIFAPVFSIIQALTPLLLVKMSELDAAGATAQVRLAGNWLAGGFAGVLLSGLVGWWVSATGVAGAAYDHIGPFLVPIGAALLGNLVLDTALLVLRFRAEPKTPHRIRLVIVSGDIVVQLALTLWLGLPGLITALTAMAAVKVVAALLIWRAVQEPPHPDRAVTA